MHCTGSSPWQMTSFASIVADLTHVLEGVQKRFDAKHGGPEFVAVAKRRKATGPDSAAADLCGSQGCLDRNWSTYANAIVVGGRLDETVDISGSGSR